MTKAVKKSTLKHKRPKRTRRRTRQPTKFGNNTLDTFFRRLNKNINRHNYDYHYKLELSDPAKDAMTDYMNHTFERIMNQAKLLVQSSRKKTLGTEDIRTAARLVLPDILYFSCNNFGNLSVARSRATYPPLHAFHWPTSDESSDDENDVK